MWQGQPMEIRQDTDGSTLPAIASASRALVFLTVPWSSPERKARQAFRVAAEKLAAVHPALGVEFFSLDEDSDWCQKWLATVGHPQLGTGYPIGSGSMLWFEQGNVVLVEIGGAGLQSGDVIARSMRLWK
jgi:hypothetical protein